MSDDHAHTHENPVDQLAYNELAARYGALYGQMTKEQTKVQILVRQRDALQEEVVRLQGLSGTEEGEVVPFDSEE